jgi:hypothetical protein
MTLSGAVTGVLISSTLECLLFFLLNAKIIVPFRVFIIFTQKKHETGYHTVPADGISNQRFRPIHPRD